MSQFKLFPHGKRDACWGQSDVSAARDGRVGERSGEIKSGSVTRWVGPSTRWLVVVCRHEEPQDEVDGFLSVMTRLPAGHVGRRSDEEAGEESSWKHKTVHINICYRYSKSCLLLSFFIQSQYLFIYLYYIFQESLFVQLNLIIFLI